MPTRRLGKRETERDMAPFGFVPGGLYTRTGSEVLSSEPYTNECQCGRSVEVTERDLLEALHLRGSHTAYI